MKLKKNILIDKKKRIYFGSRSVIFLFTISKLLNFICFKNIWITFNNFLIKIFLKDKEYIDTQ